MWPILQTMDVVALRPPDTLHRGAIISYRRPDSAHLAHRIVGLPGETVAVQDGHVLVGNDHPLHLLDEPYVRSTYMYRSAGPFTLGPDEYLTIGDNRTALTEQVVHIVSQNDILGVVSSIIFPPWRARTLDE